MNDIIHVHIYEPHVRSIFGKNSKNEKAQLHTYTCENKDECDAFGKGQCINVGNVFGARCPSGRKNVLRGFSQRARKYYEQISDWKGKYKDLYQALEQAPRKITKVYGGWMLPYSHMDMNITVPFKDKSGLFVSGCPFLTDDQMNKENIENIISFLPQAMMGGEIRSYQKESIPKFIHDFKSNYPVIFNNMLGDNDIVKKIFESMNYVGRKAYLKTVKKDHKVKLGTDYWFWDGKKVFRKDQKIMIFEPCSWSSCYCEFIPDEKATVKITDNNQVDENTVFAD